LEEASDTVKLDPKTGKPVAWSHEGDWEKTPKRNGKPVDPRGEVTNMAGQELKKAQELDELSPDTLGSYIKKASSDRAMRNFDQGVDTGSTFQDREPKFDKHNSRKDDQRRSGIHKAVGRLVKENEEPWHGIKDPALLKDLISDAQSMDYDEFYDEYSSMFDDPGEFWENYHEAMDEGMVGRIAGTLAGDAVGGPIGGAVGGAIGDKMTDESVGGGNWLEEKHKHDANDELVSDDDPFNFKGTMRDQEMNEGTALTGQYGHSGKLKAVTPQDADMMDRIKFLAGITK
jgi:hypothetical protein